MQFESRHARSADGTAIAATLWGEKSGRTIVCLSSWANVTAPWTEVTGGMDLFGVLAKHNGRIIAYDVRGTGGSTRAVDDVSLDRQVEDMLAVADLAETQAVDVLGLFDGAAVAIAFAARHPERVRKLALWYPMVDGSTWMPEDRVRGLIDLAGADWALAMRTLANISLPRGPVDAQRAVAKAFHERLTLDALVAYLHAIPRVNVETEAQGVTAETLVLYPTRAGLPVRPPQAAAALIPAAVLQSVEQEAAYPEDTRVANLIAAFFDGEALDDTGASRPAMAVILFVDIADSTPLTERLGDAAFRRSARELDDRLRTAMRAARGSVVEGKVMGDGLMAVFSSAAQAVDAAQRCVELSATSELRLHVGVHAGDVIREKSNVFGGAVNIASRICQATDAGQILVSATVRELARTSTGVSFEDRGEHTLKGIDDPIRLYEVTWNR